MRAKRFRKEWICEVQYYAKSVIANNGWVCGADKHHCACTLRIVGEKAMKYMDDGKWMWGELCMQVITQRL